LFRTQGRNVDRIIIHVFNPPHPPAPLAFFSPRNHRQNQTLPRRLSSLVLAAPVAPPGAGFWVSGFGFRVPGLGFRVSGSRFRVSGFGFQISNFGFQVPGSGFGVWGFGIREDRSPPQGHCWGAFPEQKLVVEGRELRVERGLRTSPLRKGAAGGARFLGRSFPRARFPRGAVFLCLAVPAKKLRPPAY